MQLALLVAAFAVCSPVLQAAWPEAEAGPSARPIYRMKERCTSGYHACTYRYHATQRNFDGAELQVTKVQAIVRVGCSSVGTYGEQNATRYCMSVKNVIVSGDLFKDSSTDEDEVLDDTEEEDIPELDPRETILHDPPISPEDKLLSKWFCFVQTEDGKVVAVQHPRQENTEVVNFKKNIAAAFQANFKGTTDEEEEDTMSLHHSHYRYLNDTQEAYRSVNTSGVVAYAGGTPKQDIMLNTNEYIRYDSKHWLSRSTGSTSVTLSVGDSTSQVNPPSSSEGTLAELPQFRTRRAAPTPQDGTPEPETYDASADIKEFKADGQYTLSRIGCLLDSQRERRDLHEEDVGEDAVTDSLRAKINYTLIRLHQMHLLRQQIPSVNHVLQTLHKGPENLKLADLLHRLLGLEAEHKPLPGYQPALNDVLAYLHKLKGSKEDRDRNMRKLIYSLLSPEGSFNAQKALHDAFVETTDDKEEQNTIVTYIAFASTPHLKFVQMLEKLIDVDVVSSDPLLLAYGSLASAVTGHRGSTGTEQHIVKFLLHRLNKLEKLHLENDSWPLVHLIHSLGNTDSNLTIEPLLRHLDHDELDIQLAAIGALRVHTAEPRVQEALSITLHSATAEEQVEQITQTLIEGLEHAKLNHRQGQVNEEFLVLLVSAAMQSNNSKLHHLVLHYLQQLDSPNARYLIDALKEFMAKNPGFEEGEVYYVNDEMEHGAAKARLRRGSDWDASSSIYNLVASYAQRRSDVRTYRRHKAYIWGRKFGIKKVYAQIAAGGFAGLKLDGSGYKLFAKAVAQGYAFGKRATALRAEFLRRRSGSRIYQKIYAKVVGKTLINQAGYVKPRCSTLTRNLYSANIRIFRFKFSVFIYVGTLNFYINMHAKLSLNLRLSFCETTVRACATLIPTATLRAEGGARATILLAVRGGIEVAAQFTYKLEPQVCIHYCKRFRVVKLKTCINIYHSWPNNHAQIYAYYQLRKLKIKWFKIKFKWGKKKKWSKLSKTWKLGSTKRKRIWRSCNKNIKC